MNFPLDFSDPLKEPPTGYPILKTINPLGTRHRRDLVNFSRFALKPIRDELQQADETDRNVQQLMDDFYSIIRRNIIHAKEAYLLIDLFRDLMTMSEEYGIQYPPVSSTKYLKRELLDEFGDEISFFATGRNVLVHNSKMNPCEYAIATINGKGLRDEDIIKAFGKLVQRKLSAKLSKKAPKQWPLTPGDLVAQLNEESLPVLQGAILASLGKSTSHQMSSILEPKVWALCSEWESLLTKRPSANQIAVGSVVHRLTGRKDVVEILSKLDHSIAYCDTVSLHYLNVFKINQMANQ